MCACLLRCSALLGIMLHHTQHSSNSQRHMATEQQQQEAEGAKQRNTLDLAMVCPGSKVLKT